MPPLSIPPLNIYNHSETATQFGITFDGKKKLGGSDLPAEIAQEILHAAVRGLTPRSTHALLVNFCLVNKRLFADVGMLTERLQKIEQERASAKSLINSEFRGKDIDAQIAAISTICERLKNYNHIEVDLKESELHSTLHMDLLEKLAEKRDLKTLRLHIDPNQTIGLRTGINSTVSVLASVLESDRFIPMLDALHKKGFEDMTVNFTDKLPGTRNCVGNVAKALKKYPVTFNLSSKELDFSSYISNVDQMEHLPTTNAMLLGQVIGRKKHNNSIEALNLGECGVGNAAVSFLCEGLKKGEALQSLNLSRNLINSEGAKMLADALNGIEPGKCSLKTLNLQHNDITDGNVRDQLTQAAARHGIELLL